MRVLDRYIIKAILGSVALVLAVLGALLALFLFFDEQGWVGVGSYGQLAALRDVLMNLPAILVQFLPVAALIGALAALGQLARGSELTVIRAAGVSIWRMVLTVLVAGLLLVPVAVGTGEYLAPPLTRTARIDKAMLRNADASANVTVTGRGNVWIADGARVLRVEPWQAAGGIGTITLFETGPGNQLVAVGQATGAHATAAGGWELEGYVQSGFEPQRVTSASVAVRPLDISVSPAFLSAIASDPGELSLRELKRAIGYLSANRQDVRAHRFAYWSKLAGLAAIPLAVLLALPFALGSPLGATGGMRAGVGLAFGLTWFLLQRMVASGSVVFGVDPVLLAWAPALLLAVVVLMLLVRRRSRID
jgi:lipopolysaccharide export system permease protein